MSLINDALRDLDARSPSSNSADEESTGCDANNIQPHNENTRSRRASLPIKSIGAITFSCCAVYFAWQYMQNPAKHESFPEPVDIAAVKGVPDTSPEAVAPSPAEVKNSIVAESTISEQPLAKSSSVASKQNIEEFLEKLDVAIARNRLSVPYQANALFYLAQIKALEAPSEIIESSHTKIQTAYIKQIEQAIEQEKLSFADKLLERAHKFGVSGDVISRYQEQIAQIDVQSTTVDVASISIEKRTENSRGEAITHSDKNRVSNTQEKPSSQVFAPSTSYREKQILEQANQLMSQGRVSQAEIALRDYLSHSPMATKPILVLFDSYIKRKAFGQAKALAAQISNKHETHAYFSAQIAKQERGTHAAISILEQHPPSASVENAHNALLAGLYQKSEQYQEAHQLYTALIKRDPNNSVNLLGFALSADALERYDRSISAYKQIISLGQVSPNVMAFVKKRVATLDQDRIAGAQKW